VSPVISDELKVRFEHNEEQSPLRSLAGICSPNLTWHTIRTYVIAESRIDHSIARVSLRGKSVAAHPIKNGEAMCTRFLSMQSTLDKQTHRCFELDIRKLR
jgi:hypothetical protein